MKIVYLLQVLFVWVNCQKRPARQVSGDIIPIISYVNENNGDGFYKYSYETGNGISMDVDGSLEPGEDGEKVQNAEGTYSYTAPDGRVYSVYWYADETGFHAEGDHIPPFTEKPHGPIGAPGAPVYPIK